MTTVDFDFLFRRTPSNVRKLRAIAAELQEVEAALTRIKGDAYGICIECGLPIPRTRLDVARTRGFSRLVGRVEEMAALEAALESVPSDEAPWRVGTPAGLAGLVTRHVRQRASEDERLVLQRTLR